MNLESNQVLTELLVHIVTTIDSGFGLIESEVWSLTGSLMLISLIIVGMQIAFGNGIDIAKLGGRFFSYAVIIFLVDQWLILTDLVRNSAVTLGLKAGNITSPAFLDPGAIMDMASQYVEFLLAYFWQNFSLLDGESYGVLLLGVISALLIYIAFIFVVLQLFITIIEFKLLTLAGFFLLPFSLLSKTAFITEKVFGYIASAAVKFIVLALILSISLEALTSIPMPADEQIDIDLVLRFLAISVIVAGICFTIPASAAALISGGPSLGVGTLAAGIAPVAAAAGVTALAGTAATKAVASGLSSLKNSSPAQAVSALGSGAGSTLKQAGQITKGAAGAAKAASASQSPKAGISAADAKGTE